MKKVFLLTIALSLLCLGAAAQADVTWKDVTWSPDMNVGGEAQYGHGQSSIAVNGSNLEVTTVDMYWADAYYTVSPLTTNWVEATFLDSGAGTGANLSMDTGDDYAGIGVNNYVSTNNYVVSWFNDNSDGDIVLGARSEGSHTAKLGRRTDGTVDFWFDGFLVYSATDFTPVRPMKNIFLTVDAYRGDRFQEGGDTAVFTDFSYGTDYTPVPEPSSIIALLGGLGSLLAFRRRRA